MEARTREIAPAGQQLSRVCSLPEVTNLSDGIRNGIRDPAEAAVIFPRIRGDVF